MEHYANDANNLFPFFYDHVINRPLDTYLACNGSMLTYNDCWTAINHIMQSISDATDGKAPCVALNFKDQQKLLLSFWACTALGMDIILLPELHIDLSNLATAADQPAAAIMLTDFMEGADCLQVHISHSTGIIAPWKEPANNRYSNIYFFTSGTTGNSKFIKTSYYQFVQAITCIRANNFMPYVNSQNVLITVPLFHSYGLSAMVEYTSGGSCLFLPKTKDFISPLQSLLDANIGTKITAIEGVPYFYRQMAVILSRLKLTALTHIGMGGDSVSPDLLKKLVQTNSNLSLSIRYGVTEIPSIVSLNYFRATELFNERSLGNVLPIYEVKLYDENGAMHATEGELVVECFLYPGKLTHIHTNDIIERSDQGLTFKSRKIFIKYKGYKINPVEIEHSLNEHPDISEVRVHLVNEILTAEIVSGSKTSLDTKEIREYLQQHISSYMIPDQFLFVDVIQRTRTGKIMRR